MGFRTQVAMAVCLLCAAAVVAAQQNAPDVQITKGPVVEHVSLDSATIAWSTNVNAGTVLKYGIDPKNLTQTAEAPWGGITHRVHLNNLQPNTTYYFQAQSAQGQGTGTSAVSSVSQFKTLAGAASSGSAPPRLNLS
jgi:hypothetical protein